MARLHSVSGSPLALLAHIKQDQRRVGLEAFTQGVDGELLDASLGILDQGEKTGRVIHWFNRFDHRRALEKRFSRGKLEPNAPTLSPHSSTTPQPFPRPEYRIGLQR